MAREVSDREDLLAEAKNLVERAELLIADDAEPVIVGFRRDGCLSLFFGADPVYQFNTQGALRRAYVGGRLIKAEKGRLVALERQRASGEIHLVRHEFDADATKLFLTTLSECLNGLSQSLAAGHFAVVRQAPVDGAVAQRVLDWLSEHLAKPLLIANSPHAK